MWRSNKKKLICCTRQRYTTTQRPIPTAPAEAASILNRSLKLLCATCLVHSCPPRKSSAPPPTQPLPLTGARLDPTLAVAAWPACCNIVLQPQAQVMYLPNSCNQPQQATTTQSVPAAARALMFMLQPISFSLRSNKRSLQPTQTPASTLATGHNECSRQGHQRSMFVKHDFSNNTRSQHLPQSCSDSGSR